MQNAKKVFVWIAVAFVLLTAFTAQDVTTIVTTLAVALERVMNALAGAAG